ncbi:glutaredoxin family protein [Sporosarcina sp. Sa2YVA2]|uniref:Glutaredoxin family protein n=1 Tax=Sporosarcina quadrami TaxID=2762234 RepID=A0ABR8UDC4_9BACL|nr:glutaredoxin family protein [Sporosarcina quadrami]MBD7985708.1 glutaredoxin family protein [Sporosarcina quadrami]
MHVNFYSRKNCQLCEEAEAMLKLVQEDYPLTWSTIDIESDDEIHEKYMLMIPVIEMNGKVLAYGNVGYMDIIELF